MSSDHFVGSVEFFKESDGGWFEVCDDGWDDADAKASTEIILDIFFAQYIY